MIEWLKSILPRIKEYSVKLDKAETLVDKTWVWVGLDENYTSLHFLRDQRLLVSKLGNVQEGSWEFIGGDLLHIKGDDFNVLLNHGIFFEGLLVIQKKGVTDSYEILYDEKVIPDGDIVKHIERRIDRIILSKTTFKGDFPFIITVNGTDLYFPTKPEIEMVLNTKEPFNGRVYGLPNYWGAELRNSKVVRVFKTATLKTDRGVIDLEIDNLNYEYPKGRGYYKGKSELPNGVFQIEEVTPNYFNWGRVIFTNGKLEKTSMLNNRAVYIILFFVFALLFGLFVGL